MTPRLASRINKVELQPTNQTIPVCPSNLPERDLVKHSLSLGEGMQEPSE